MNVYRHCLIAVVLGPIVAWGQIGDMPRGRTEEEDIVHVFTTGAMVQMFLLTPKATPFTAIDRDSIERADDDEFRLAT